MPNTRPIPPKPAARFTFAPGDIAPVRRPEPFAERVDIRHAVGNITARERRDAQDALAQVERAARSAAYRTPALMLPGNGR